MKTTTLPPLRVSPELREFIARGISSAERTRKSGKYIGAERVLAKLERRLSKARKRRG